MTAKKIKELADEYCVRGGAVATATLKNGSIAGLVEELAEARKELFAAIDKLTADNKALVEALQTGLEYAEEKLIEYDQAYNMHPATEAGRGIITSDIATIRAALEQHGGAV